jgi:hypothetical protein
MDIDDDYRHDRRIRGVIRSRDTIGACTELSPLKI